MSGEPRSSPDRLRLLADVAEMYYLEGKDQSDIAQVVGVTRSMVSRMLSEARQRGIVEIHINRPIHSETILEMELVNRFGLKSALVIAARSENDEQLLNSLGLAGAQVLSQHITPGVVIGLAWGTSINAVINALDPVEAGERPAQVVQMVGAMGARNAEYDGHALVQRLAEKLSGEGYFINAPFLCQSPEVASALLVTQSIQETIAQCQKVQVALLGIGSVLPQYSSFYLAGYVPQDELDKIHASGAVGDIAGIHFNIDGEIVCDDFYRRLVTIRKEDLLSIPNRVGVAGGPGKVEPVLGALRGKLINILVTDSFTARKVLENDLEV